MMAERAKAVLEGQGPDRHRHVRLGPVDHLRGLRRHQADARGLPLEQSRSQRPPLHGLRRSRVHAHLRHGRADGLLRRFRGRRRVRAVGLEHGGDASDPVDAPRRPPAQPSACEGRGAFDFHQPQLGPCRHPHRVQAGHRSCDPQLHRQPHHHDRARQPGLRQEPHRLRQGRDRHRLWPEGRPSARTEGQRRRQSRRDPADRFRRLCRAS